MNICFLYSRLFDGELNRITKENQWSYLSIRRNRLTLIQNIAVVRHPKAQWLYKMDEEIFVTKHCFQTMLDTYCRVFKDDTYNTSFVAPLTPINGYGHVRFFAEAGDGRSL